jgi:hypothetical protein
MEEGFTLEKEHMQGARLLTMRSGLKLEMVGLKMSRGINCFKMIKEETGLKGSKQKVYDDFSNLLRKAGILID